MNEEITALSRREQAVIEHEKVCARAGAVIDNFIEMGLALKRIRDGKLYAELGFETFGEYVELNGAYSFKESQAYKYIRLVEQNSPEYLAHHASLGIEKLSMLSKLPGFEREEFIEEKQVAGLSTREVEELIKAHQGQGEQLSLLLDEKKSAEDELARLQAQLLDLESRPIETAVREPSEEEKQALRDEGKAAAEKAAKGQIKDLKAAHKRELETKTAELKARAEQAAQALEKEQQSSAALRSQLEEAQAQSQRLQMKLTSGTPDEARAALRIYFEEAQKAVNSFIKAVGRLSDKEEQERFMQKAAGWLSSLAKMLGGDNE